MKHGAFFEEAKTVFDDSSYVDFFDPDHADDEISPSQLCDAHFSMDEGERFRLWKVNNAHNSTDIFRRIRLTGYVGAGQ